MNSELIKALTWAIVELEVGRPNVADIKANLQRALLEATGLTLKHDIRRDNLVRMSHFMGGI